MGFMGVEPPPSKFWKKTKNLNDFISLNEKVGCANDLSSQDGEMPIPVFVFGNDIN